MLIAMRKLVHVYILVVFVAKYFCESKHFCQSFSENGFKIDFGFGNKYTNLGQDVINLVIGQQFWVIGKNDQGQKLNFVSTESSTNEVFGKHYKMGFYMNFGRIGLQAEPADFQHAGVGVRHYRPMWRAYSYAIDWIQWSPNGSDYNTFKRTDKWETVLFYPFNDEQGNSSVFAFHMRYIERNDSFSEIGFVEQEYDETNAKFIRNWNYWRIFTDENTLVRIKFDLDKRVMIKHLDIIDISSSYLMNKNNTHLDYAILFLENSSISYCYMSTGCTEDKLQKLIDCKPMTESLEGSVDENTAIYTLSIMIKVIILSLVIIGLFFISWKLIEKQNQ